MLNLNKLKYGLKTLLARFHEINLNQLRHLHFRIMTPLIQIKAYDFDKKYIQHKCRKKIGRFTYDHVLIMYSNHHNNVLRSKLINKKRELLINMVDRYGVKNTLYYVYLNKINDWVPNVELQKHVEYIFSRSKLNPDPNANLIDIVRDIATNYKTWTKIITPEGHRKPMNMKQFEQTYNNLKFNVLYFLENCPDKQNIATDMRTLKLTLTKFNIFEYFMHIKSNDVRTSYKLCQRFIKMTKWKSKNSEKYLLGFLKNRNIEGLYRSIDLILQSYEIYYK